MFTLRNVASLVLFAIIIISTIVYRIWRKHHMIVVDDEVNQELEDNAMAYRRQLKEEQELMIEGYEEDE